MKTAVIVIGRFQPMHEGHLHLLREAEKLGDLNILIGSANRCPSIRNPFTYWQRRGLIGQYFSDAKFYALDDFMYDDNAWRYQVVNIIDSLSSSYDRIVMVGHSKEGNDYLKWFPTVQYVEVDMKYNVSGTERREELFKNRSHLVAHIQSDWDFFEREKELFGNYPFPETLSFMCADAIVVWENEVLLIERAVAPGAGTWAFPGGFRNANETFQQCAERELFEETGLVVDFSLKLIDTKLYDDPKRAMGIMRVTKAFLYRSYAAEKPKVLAQDDASNVQWFRLDELPMLFSDHQDILADILK